MKSEKPAKKLALQKHTIKQLRVHSDLRTGPTLLVSAQCHTNGANVTRLCSGLAGCGDSVGCTV